MEVECLDACERLAGLHRCPCLPDIVRRLLRQPHFSCRAVVTPQPTLDSKRHRRADGCPSIEHFGPVCAIDTQLGRSFAHLQIQGGQDVIPQGQAVVGGLNIELMVTSVVVLVVHHDGIAVFKRKRQTPVAIDADRPGRLDDLDPISGDEAPEANAGIGVVHDDRIPSIGTEFEQQAPCGAKVLYHAVRNKDPRVPSCKEVSMKQKIQSSWS